jgi:Ca-activated chloride channel family protein
MALFAIRGVVSAQSVIDLVVHYVEGVPAEGEIAYDVKVYLSAVDGTGSPIKDLSISSLTVSEDSQKVQIGNLELVKDEPINLVIVLDVSGSMVGPGIEAAKNAATNFITSLGGEDRVAIITFDQNVTTQLDFTADHTTARSQLTEIQAERGAGTCLYDATYQAVQMASTLPSGRRAVILFTDGVDETSIGAVCSTHTLGDVINIASDGGTRTPIYSLGMGGRIDENTLKRLADLTGGRYLNSPDTTQLDAVFLRLSEQLRSQYILTYKSISGPGAHTLAVSVGDSGSKDSDTRNFLLPAMSTHIVFTSPIDGAAVNGGIKAAVAAYGSNENLIGVTFEINGEVVEMDSSFPYEIDLNLDPYKTGNLTLSAIAYGSNNVELARSTITIIHTEEEKVTASPTMIPNSVNSFPIVGISIGVLVIIIIILTLYVILRRQHPKIPQEKVLVEDHSFDFVKTYVGEYAEDFHSVDKPEVNAEAFGSLIVESSDDPSMIGHRFEITSGLITLGRSADNDIIFPKDNPVSRHHAEISEKRGALYLMEISLTDKSGSLKTPTFGTFINDIQLGPTPVLLQNGDVVGLGKRVRLKFETSRIASVIDPKTYDELDSINDSEET